ncbi:hypothetical protein G7Z17_g2398 [Cylindrodendrum hubeiense]|uniref:Peptidase metallopeptidase domain-containing protein n=1 Tax=Cylindrodendrum hubeiense TaxID=595255 RepID=A0A9P5HNB1_9HYPO|nr:hypothetical protein G7Z17_g2398 [Cylindrodendrum hubeiense]
MADNSEMPGCIHMPVPEGLEADADVAAINENPANGHFITSAGPDDGSDGENDEFEPIELAVAIKKRWKNGRTLRVKFINGSDRLKGKVRQYSIIWSQYANIKFKFVDSGDAEIRINTNPNYRDNSRAHWSFVGTDSLTAPPGEPTMNFGMFDENTEDGEFRRVILHEFGHALGCHHEHQSPAAKAIWNEQLVIDAMRKAHGWLPERVRRNILDPYNNADTFNTKLDPKSIMGYTFPASWTKNRVVFSPGNNLSEMDKRFIARIYPGAALDIEFFNTLELRPWNKPEKEASKRQQFSKTYKSPPSLAVGLNWLDLSKNFNIRVKAFADNVTNSSADFHLDTWSDSIIHSAGCTWFRKPSDDKEFQIGKFNTLEDHSWKTPKAKTSHQVKFKHPYQKAPKVVVWLNHLDFAKGKDWRIKATATDITATGFKLNLDSWSDTVVYSAGAAWIAYPADRDGLASGTFSTLDVRPASQPKLLTRGIERFPRGTFKRNPKVLIAFNSIDADCHKNLRVKLGASSVSPRGMRWHINSWADSPLKSAGVSYIAFNS